MIEKHYGTCEFCGKLFTKYSNNQKFCNDLCRSRYIAVQRRKLEQNKKKATPTMNINDIMKAAKAEGLQYGQYIVKHNL